MGQMNDLNNFQWFCLLHSFFLSSSFIYMFVFTCFEELLKSIWIFSHCEENCHGEYAHRWKARRECAWLAEMGEQSTITIVPSLRLAGNKMQECVLVCMDRRERNAMRIARFSLHLERARIFYL